MERLGTFTFMQVIIIFGKTRMPHAANGLDLILMVLPNLVWKKLVRVLELILISY